MSEVRWYISFLHFKTYFPDTLNYFALTVTNALLSLAENTNNKQNALVYFFFAFQDLQNSISWGPPFVLCCGL